MKKYKKSLFIISVLFLTIFSVIPFNVKGILPDSIDYTFFNNNLYNSTNPLFNESNNVNVRNHQESNGVYNGTYSFTKDIIGTEPIGWIASNDVDCNTTIILSLDNHKNILQLSDNNSGGNVNFIRNEFSSGQIKGTVEFWIRTNDVNSSTFIRFSTVTNRKINLAINGNTDGKLQYFNGTWNNIDDITNNIWYHIRVDFESGNSGYKGLISDTFDLYVNNIKKLSGGEFEFLATNINRIELSTSTSDFGYNSYFDAFHYNWLDIEFSSFTYTFQETSDVEFNTSIFPYESWLYDKDGGEYPEIGAGIPSGAGIDGNFLRLVDNRGDKRVLVKETLNIAESLLSISFWFRAKTDKNYNFNYRNSINLTVAHLGYYDSDLVDVSDGNRVLFDLTIDKWYNILIHFDSNTDLYDVYLNDSFIETNNFSVESNYIKSVEFYTQVVGSPAVFDIDSVNIEVFINSTIGLNLFPYIETFNKEVDKFAFDMVSANTLYDIGTDNPSGWTDIENGYDHTNIALDNTDISGGSITNSRVVQIEGIGSTHEITGIEKDFSIQEGVLNITMKFNISSFDNAPVANFSIYIYGYEAQLRTKITLRHPNPSMWGGGLWYGNGTHDINLLPFSESKFSWRQEITYNIYIDSFVIFRAKSIGFRGIQNVSYTFPVIDLQNRKGLGKIQVFSLIGDSANENMVYDVQSIGVYSNSTSLSDDFGYLPLRLGNSTGWLFVRQNLITMTALGTFSMLSASIDDWILEGNMELVNELETFDLTQDINNVYFQEFEHFPVFTGIPNPIIVFFIKSQFNLTSISIDGIQFKDDIPDNIGYLAYESGGVNDDTSYFYLDSSNRLNYFHISDESGVKEFIQAELIIGGLDTNDTAIQFSSNKNNNAFGFFRINYVSTSTILEIQSVFKTTVFLLPNSKSIISYIILITDNNDNSITGLTTGYVSNIKLLYTEQIITTVITFSLLTVLIPLIIILIPSLGLKVRFGRFVFIPMFLLMSIVSVISGLIPFWLFFIIVLSSSLFIFNEKDNGVDI